MADKTQALIIYEYVASAGIKGVKKHDVLQYGLNKYITCADRYLRQLAEEGMLVGIMQTGDHEKTWYAKGKEKGELF